MRKSVSFGAKPQPAAPRAATPDQWVSGAVTEPTGEAVKTKRLTIDIPESLHRSIKTQCASRGLRMSDEIRDILERHYMGQDEATQ